MADDPYPVSNKGNISSLPTSYISALSAIQEQSFIEAGFDNPDFYDQLFTYKHKASFIKTGFLVGIHDAFFILLGTLLLKLADCGALHPFKHEILTKIDYIILYFINVSPFLITFFLTFRTFIKITGVISRKMALYLVCGFSLGVFTLAALLFMLSYYLGIEKAREIYLFIDFFSKYVEIAGKIADFYWDYIRPVFLEGTWQQLKDVSIISFALFMLYFYQILYLKISKKRKE